MPSNRTQRSDFDRRIASGLKVMFTGSEAGRWTPTQLRDSRFIARVRCSCLRMGHVEHYKLIEAGYGDRPLSELAARMRCAGCGKLGASVEVVDPWRNALEG